MRHRVRAWLLRLRGFFNKQRRDCDFAAELESHLQMHIEDNLRAGMTPEEARRQALIKLGGIEQAKERYRDRRSIPGLETLFQDLRYGARQLRRNPGFTAVAVITLALGIGANTAIFSLIDAVMLKMLPVKNPEQLVLLNWVSQKRPAALKVQTGYSSEDKTGRWSSPSFSYPSFEEFRAHNQIFSSLFGFDPLGQATVNIGGEASLADGELVTGDYFSALGVSPVLGRAITDEDEKPGASRVVVISYGYWSRRFGRSPSVLGKAITVNSVPVTIVGVAPPEFFGIQPGRAVDLWVPLVERSRLLPWGMSSTPGNRSLFMSKGWWWLMMMGRLKPGITERHANAQLDFLFRRSTTTSLESPPKPQWIPHIQLEHASKGLEMLREEFSKPLWILMIVVGLVLLIACANVASLLLARSAARQKEIAVRLSLGAPRRRLIRQLLTESLLLGGLGGTLGLLFAYWGSHALLLVMSSGGAPISLNVQLDARILGFTAAASVLTGVLFGLAPSFRSTRVDLTPALKVSASTLPATSAQTRLGLGKALAVSQIALSLLLLAGAGLLVRTLENLEDQNLGFNQHSLLLFGVDATQNGYKGERLVNFYGQLLQRLQALPGVASATMSTETLVSGSQDHWPITIEAYKPEPGQDMGVDWNNVGPAFFEAMDIRVLLGRGIEWRDTASSPKAAVVNEALVRAFFGGRNPLGHRFRFENLGSPADEYAIVGVTKDAKYASLKDAPRPTVYVPYNQMPVPLGRMHFEVRTAGDPMTLVPTVRRLLHDLGPSLPLSGVKTQTEQIAETLVQERLFAWLSGLFGALALLLAAIGLYGLFAYAVTRRTGEIGIRMALGAQRSSIFWMVFRETLLLVGIGVALGLAFELALGRLVSSLMFGLKPTDALTLLLATALLVAVALLACFLPARRATKVDPMVALRYE